MVYQGHVIDHWYVPNYINNLDKKNDSYNSAKGYGLRVREQDNGYTGKVTTSLEVKRLLIPNQHEACLEQELDVISYVEANKLLNLMNHIEFVTIDKDRLIYAYKGFKVVIDDIKNFYTGVEIELVTSENRKNVIKNIKKIASELGIDVTHALVDKSITFMFMQEYSRF